MSGNSLGALLAWMRDNPNLSGWDFITAFSAGQLNSLLQAHHVQRWLTHTAIDDLTGTLQIANTKLTYHLFGYRLGPASLVPGQASWQTPRLTQAVAMEGGLLVATERGEVTALSAHDALDALALQYRLPVASDGPRLSVDLAQIEQVHFALSDQVAGSEESTAFIRALFNALPESKRVSTLFDFPSVPGNRFLGVRQLALRTHDSKADGQLAVVLFASLEQGPTGSLPSDRSNFPFLLPDDLPGDVPANACVLLSRRVLHRAAYANGLTGMFDAAAFSYTHAGQVLTEMRATSGVLRGARRQVRTRDFMFNCEAFEVPAAGGIEPLGALFDDDGVQMTWRSQFALKCSYTRHDSQYPQVLAVTFAFTMSHRFDLCLATPAEDAGGLLLGYFHWPLGVIGEVTPVSGMPTLPAAEVAQIEHAAGLVLKQAILEGLSRNLTAYVPEQLLATALLPGGTSLFVEHAEYPHGLAAFVKAQGADAFRLIDENVHLAAGASHVFRVYPPQVGVRWSVAVLPGERGEPGRIDPTTGVYTAPPRHAIDDNGVKIRITVTQPSTAIQQVGLITVLPHALTVNPLIQVCWSEDQVELSAGTTGEQLEWQIINPRPGSGTLDVVEGAPFKRTYIAGAQVADLHYVLDEVQVRDVTSGQERSLHVLVRQKPSSLTLTCTPLAAGRRQFTAMFNGQPMADVNWRVALGPGHFVQRGRYEPGSNDGERFLLVFADLDSPFGLLEGHLIVVLDERWPDAVWVGSETTTHSDIDPRG
ncbi:hypothetical protein [Pseudomonas sp. CJQ_11]|uniref:hypothetical protein n=1 Tax=Pseudomonas sp. CJQ_11 TaxID=3367169 RepID=UPI000A405CA0